MRISIAKALKLKNKKVSKIKQLEYRILENNSYNKVNTPPYNSRQALKDYDDEVTSLIKLKTEINKANVNITGTILKLGEIKSKVQFLKNLPTTEGELTDRYSSGNVTIIVATISKIEADKMIEALEEEIESLQDEIDHFNATTFIEI